MSAPLTDYFQVGAAIKSRLVDANLGLLDVGDLAPLADALAGAQDADIAKRLSALAPRSPAAFVGYDTDLMQWDSEAGGHLLLQRWLIVLVVRNAADTARGGAIMAAAGPLLLNTIQLLSGWRPGIDGIGELIHTAGPRPAFGPGIGLFPVAFLAPVFIPGANP